MTRDERIAELKVKLAARDGQPGFAVNSAAIREQIAMIENGENRYRSEVTGRYVDLSHLIQNPRTTTEA